MRVRDVLSLNKQISLHIIFSLLLCKQLSLYKECNMPQTTRNKVLYLLKSRGAQTAVTIAAELELTSMGARQQLLKLSESGEISSYLEPKGKGRPKRFWLLTEAGQVNFPDRHADLTLELIDSISTIFGADGLEKLIETREQVTLNKYTNRLKNKNFIHNRLVELAQIRTEEGYMAEVKQTNEGFVLLENHCPICAAAKICQGFCRSELELFQKLFEDLAQIERTEHQIQGARRCAYVITPLKVAV